MKYRHYLATGISFLVLLLSWCVLASDARAQQRGDAITPQELTEQEVMRTIARLNSKMGDPLETSQRLQYQLDLLQAELQFDLRMKEELEKAQRRSEAEAVDIDHWIRIAIEESERPGLLLVDRETTSLLMRNCMIELQRIEWELAAEKGLPKPKANIRQREIAELSIQARRAEVEAIKTEIGSVQGLEKSLGKSAFDARMSEVRAKLTEAELKLTEAMARLEALTDDPVTDAAAKVSQLVERKEAIAKQLEMLKGQQTAWLGIDWKKLELDSLHKRAETIAERLTRIELQHLSRSTTVDLVEKTLKAFESQKPAATPSSDR